VSPLQQQIVAAMAVKPQIDPQQEIVARVNFIKQVLLGSSCTTLVLGLSGGVDSTLTGKLAQQAVNELRQQSSLPLAASYRFIAMRLPFAVQLDEQDCQLAIDFIQPDQLITLNIQPMVEGLVDQLSLHDHLEPSATDQQQDFIKGNTKARMRMAAQYHIAAWHRGLVLGTDHSAEAVTGFYTKFGDGACDLAPLFGLNKRQNKALASYSGCPEQLCHKMPTADLEELNPQRADEQVLGVGYQAIDDYLEGKSIRPEFAQRIEQLYLATGHKRRLPYTLQDHPYEKIQI
jgi:NAD+ synthase